MDYHLERGGMPVHDAVGVNDKKGATTENQGAGAGCTKVLGVTLANGDRIHHDGCSGKQCVPI